MSDDNETLFDREKDVASHLKDIGVLLLDLSDSVKSKLSEKDIEEIKGLVTTFGMNCDAVTDDITGAEGVLKSVRKKTLIVCKKKISVPELRKHLADSKTAIARLRRSAKEFLAARDRDLVFKEMNKDYSDVLGEITELMSESAMLRL
jgi:hypothetical protein